jgi:hypothetical protein
MTHRRALVTATLVIALSTGCSVGVVAPGPGSAPPTATDTTGEELPAVYSHDGVTLHLQGLAELQAAYVDDPGAARVRLLVGQDGRPTFGVSDCFPLPVAVVVEQTDRQVTIAVGSYGPGTAVPDDLACPAIAPPPHELDVELDAVLGDRLLVDEAASVVAVSGQTSSRE